MRYTCKLLDIEQLISQAAIEALGVAVLPGTSRLDVQRLYSQSLEPRSIETRDVINRHLLSRGFTLLEGEGILSVVKIASINPALVPRVEPSELNNQPPHRFLRTSFELSFLVATDVEEEFKSMTSPNGKITALSATNRLEVMDAAANLLDIHRVIEQEQSSAALEGLAREFKLEYARAEAVKPQLESFLGINRPSSSGGRGGMGMDRSHQ